MWWLGTIRSASLELVVVDPRLSGESGGMAIQGVKTSSTNLHHNLAYHHIVAHHHEAASLISLLMVSDSSPTFTKSLQSNSETRKWTALLTELNDWMMAS
jgi:hypothetical protein